jgi:hypothetical protein
MQKLFSNGIEMDTNPEKFGELIDSSAVIDDLTELRRRMHEDGYLFMRGLLDQEEVLRARHEILLKFSIIGEIDERFPLMDAIYSDRSFREQVNLRAFSKCIRTGAAYQNVTYNKNLLDFYRRLLGGPVKPYSFQWPRLVRPGEGCGVHYDAPYMNRGTTSSLYTSWIPLGDVTKQEGALILLENSHRDENLINSYGKKDVDKETLGWFSTNPAKVRNRFGGRWLTADFRAGDVLCFGMFMMHAALDNHSPVNRCRLTSDTRYQLLSESIDERWVGEDPIAHGRDKVFFPGLGTWGNKELQDEWKKVDAYGRLLPL